MENVHVWGLGIKISQNANFKVKYATSMEAAWNVICVMTQILAIL
jgi:hypothetical protein